MTGAPETGLVLYDEARRALAAEICAGQLRVIAAVAERAT